MSATCRVHTSKCRPCYCPGLRAIVLTGIAFWLLVCHQLIALAQSPTPTEPPDQPQTRTSVVTASVPDIVPPSVPILIAPANSSLLTTNQVSFVWEASSDNVGVDHYQFWLDGQLVFANLDPLGETNGQYTLTVNGSQLSLLPATPQTDGSHTWKIVAVDAAGNQTNSATWQFSVDTQQPVFLITNIDGQATSISSQDPLTVPATPIPVTSSQPILSGYSEPNSTGVVLLSIPNQAIQLITFNIGSNGQWQIQLPTLPYDSIATLNFTITDPAGNVSVLNDLLLLRSSSPLPTSTASPTPSSGSPQATPTPTQVSPWPVWPPIGLPIIPTPSAPPSIVIPGFPPIPLPIPSPVQPIVDQVTRIGQTPRALLAQMMPIAMEATWQRQKLTLISPISALLEALGWLWLSLPLLVSVIWLSRFLHNAFSLRGMGQVWWALGMGKGVRPQGVMLSLPVAQPLPFATLITISELQDGQTVISYRLSNRFGEYLPDQLLAGKHRLVVESPGHHFPAVFNVPAHKKFSSYYLGQSWQIDDDHLEPMLILPLLKTDQPSRRVPPEWLIKLTHHQGKAVGGQLLLILVTLILVPSLLNGLAMITLLVLITRSGFQRSKKSHQLARAYNRQLQPITWGGIIMGEDPSQQQVLAIWQGQLTQVIDDQLVSASPVLCQAVTAVGGAVKLSEDVCSVQKDQVVV